MVTLTPEDKRVLIGAVYGDDDEHVRDVDEACDAVLAAVEAILRRHVAAALNAAADEIEARSAHHAGWIASPSSAYFDAARIVRARTPQTSPPP